MQKTIHKKFNFCIADMLIQTEGQVSNVISDTVDNFDVATAVDTTILSQGTKMIVDGVKSSIKRKLSSVDVYNIIATQLDVYIMANPTTFSSTVLSTAETHVFPMVLESVQKRFCWNCNHVYNPF